MEKVVEEEQPRAAPFGPRTPANERGLPPRAPPFITASTGPKRERSKEEASKGSRTGSMGGSRGGSRGASKGRNQPNETFRYSAGRGKAGISPIY